MLYAFTAPADPSGMRRLALLLPVAALAIVAVVWGVATFATSEVNDQPGPSAKARAVEPTATPTRAPQTVRLAPGQTVCQGVLHVPERGAARTFPDLYTQRTEVNGIYIVAAAIVDPRAFEEARKTVERTLARPEIREPLVEQGAYVIIAARGQGVLDLPEFACLDNRGSRSFFSHVCGIADRADYPVATVNEGDLLGDADAPCGGLNILYHELGHLIQNWSLPPPDYFDVKQFYQDAMSAGRFQGEHAGENPNEYFAEGVQRYFLSGVANGDKDRAWLKDYDAQLYELIDRLFQD